MVVVLSKAGDQVPVMPLVEVFGKADKLLPEHIGATALKVGEILVAIVIVTTAEHPLLSV